MLATNSPCFEASARALTIGMRAAKRSCMNTIRFTSRVHAGLFILSIVAPGCGSKVVDTEGASVAQLEGATDPNNDGQTLPSDVCWVDLGPKVPGECTIGDVRECPQGTGSNGYCMQKCVNVHGTAVWGVTTTNFECPFYDTWLHKSEDPQCGCNTPLVLAYDDGHVTFTSERGASFDLSRDGGAPATDWPTAATPWLALDRDGDGRITSGAELFGSATRLASGELATNGFEALRELDDDHNGFLDPRDPSFTKLVVWSDVNLDRASTPDEIVSLAAAGVTSIDLHDRRAPRCDARNNCEGERSAFGFVDASGAPRVGAVIDVYLPAR